MKANGHLLDSGREANLGRDSSPESYQVRSDGQDARFQTAQGTSLVQTLKKETDSQSEVGLPWRPSYLRKRILDLRDAMAATRVSKAILLHHGIIMAQCVASCRVRSATMLGYSWQTGQSPT